MKTRQEAFAEAERLLNENLGDLPELMAKILRAGISAGPRAPLVAAWCAENPAQAAAIVGAMAYLQAFRINEARLQKGRSTA